MAESDLIRGNVDTVILKVLYEGDRYGYDMIKQINARSGGQWEIKQPTLYACLKRLEKQGFVASYWDASESNGGRRKYYTLTESGRDVFVSYKNEWERSRDLFGELITNDEPIYQADDFSDVEDDEYEIPKRRPSRPSRPREKAGKKEEKQAATVEYIPPAYDETEYIHSTEEEQNEAAPEPAEAAPEPALEEEEKPRDSFVQHSIFDILDEPKPEEKQEDNSEEPQVEDKGYEIYEEPSDDVSGKTADPHSLIEELYASTYTGSRSYADARVSETSEAESTTKALQKTEPTAPPAPVSEKPHDVQPYADKLPVQEESAAKREYKDILGDLVSRCEAENEKIEDSVAKEQAASATQERGTKVRRFDDVKNAVAELGNDVTVRSHNDSAKQYTQKYYYYSNRLMMTHYTVMCAVMFLIGLVLFLTFYVGLNMRMQYDYVLYVFAGLLPIIMFIVAVIVFAGNPDKKKRININPRFTMIIRTVIMLQTAVIIYCFNLIWGMPVGFSETYIPSLVIPLAYSLFIPISGAIFLTLLKSEHYAVE
ncbi:MAG: helix-turn-helix transcriptional regulator [Clostridiales bacterium]|nr:helix-turn-helix transcriptional regulator [Clostridiales bacterium]